MLPAQFPVSPWAADSLWGNLVFAETGLPQWSQGQLSRLLSSFPCIDFSFSNFSVISSFPVGSFLILFVLFSLFSMCCEIRSWTDCDMLPDFTPPCSFSHVSVFYLSCSVLNVCCCVTNYISPPPKKALCCKTVRICYLRVPVNQEFGSSWVW